MTSQANRPALASVTARWTTFSLLERQSCVLTPYRFSKAAVSGPESCVLSDV